MKNGAESSGTPGCEYEIRVSKGLKESGRFNLTLCRCTELYKASEAAAHKSCPTSKAPNPKTKLGGATAQFSIVLKVRSANQTSLYEVGLFGPQHGDPKRMWDEADFLRRMVTRVEDKFGSGLCKVVSAIAQDQRSKHRHKLNLIALNSLLTTGTSR